MIKLYSNCVTVQISNKLLAETADSLQDILEKRTYNFQISNHEVEVKKRKEWCIAQ